MPNLISFYMPAGSILNLRAFVNRVTTHCIESALFAVWVQNLYSLVKNMLYFHLLQALPSPETIRRKDFQIETLKTWQECYEIWFSFFHCLMFLQERFNTWHRCSETFAVASKTSPPGLIRLNTNSRCINLKILVLNIFSTDRVWSPSWDTFSGWF